jgi:hypothetical protein
MIGASELDPSSNSGAMTQAQAYEKREALMRDDEWRSKYLAGDKAAYAEMQQVCRAIAGPVAWTKPDSVTREQLDATWSRYAQFSLDEEREFTEAKPIALTERQRLENQLARMKGDKEFARRLFEGSQEAKREWALVNRRLALPVQRADHP